MQHNRADVVRVASSFVGARRGDGTHDLILKTYNGYKHSNWNVNTPWCAIYFPSWLFDLAIQTSRFRLPVAR